MSSQAAAIHSTANPASSDRDGMQERIKAYPWEMTSLGPSGSWPPGLTITVRLALTTRHPMFIFWGDELICLYNDSYSQSLGPEKHPSILGKPGRDAWPEIWPIIGPQIDLVMRGDGATWNENQLVPIFRNGSIEEVYWTYSFGPIDDPSAPTGVGGVLVVCTETTAHVLAERHRMADVERLRTLFDQAPGFMCVLRGPEHIFELANDAYFRLTGNRELIGKRVNDAFPEVAAQGFSDLLDGVYTSGQPYVGRGQHILLEQENASLEPDKRILDFVYQPIRDATGKVTGIFCEGTDVTESWRAQHALAQSEARVRAALAVARLGTFEWNDDAEIVTLDARSRELFGLNCGNDASIASVLACIDPDEHHRLSAELRSAFDETRRLETEFRVCLPDGSRRFLVCVGDVLPGESGQPARVIGVLADVTDRRRAESEHRILIDALTHDVVSPLNALLFQAQLLRRQITRTGLPDASTVLNRLTSFEELAHRLDGLITALSDHARLARSEEDLHHEEVDLVRLVREIVDDVRTITDLQPLHIHAPETAVTGWWDPSLIRRLITNLVENAIKYSPQGGVITLELGVSAGSAELTVRDEGIGIPAADIASIFEVRRRGSNVGEIAGSGIGLAGVKQIVDRHGGSIVAESIEGQGATFHVRLPLSHEVVLPQRS